MRIRLGIFGFVLVLAVSGLCGEEKVHTVQKGETLYSIARTLGIKADELMKHNGISDPTRLQEGQKLKIPGTEVQAAAQTSQRAVSSAAANTAASTSYRVVRGDTLYSIARKYSVTVASILEVNNLSENYVLREGATLKLPANAKTQAGAGGSAGTATVQGALRETQPRETESRPVNPSVRWPIAGSEVSYMTGKLSGVVITGQRTESVTSLTRGTVLSAGPFQGFGRVAIIQVEGGYLYVYGGCESLSVKEGDKVGPGTELGKLGIDAVSNKPQLFFMVYRSNTPVDPAKAPRA